MPHTQRRRCDLSAIRTPPSHFRMTRMTEKARRWVPLLMFEVVRTCIGSDAAVVLQGRRTNQVATRYISTTSTRMVCSTTRWKKQTSRTFRFRRIRLPGTRLDSDCLRHRAAHIFQRSFASNMNSGSVNLWRSSKITFTGCLT